MADIKAIGKLKKTVLKNEYFYSTVSVILGAMLGIGGSLMVILLANDPLQLLALFVVVSVVFVVGVDINYRATRYLGHLADVQMRALSDQIPIDVTHSRLRANIELLDTISPEQAKALFADIQDSRKITVSSPGLTPAQSTEWLKAYEEQQDAKLPKQDEPLAPYATDTQVEAPGPDDTKIKPGFGSELPRETSRFITPLPQDILSEKLGHNIAQGPAL